MTKKTNKGKAKKAARLAAAAARAALLDCAEAWQRHEKTTVVLPIRSVGNSHNRKELRNVLKKCWQCHTRPADGAPPLRVCVGCNCALYCNEKCQTTHWGASHRKEPPTVSESTV